MVQVVGHHPQIKHEAKYKFLCCPNSETTTAWLNLQSIFTLEYWTNLNSLLEGQLKDIWKLIIDVKEADIYMCSKKSL